MCISISFLKKRKYFLNLNLCKFSETLRFFQIKVKMLRSWFYFTMASCESLVAEFKVSTLFIGSMNFLAILLNCVLFYGGVRIVYSGSINSSGCKFLTTLSRSAKTLSDFRYVMKCARPLWIDHFIDLDAILLL